MKKIKIIASLLCLGVVSLEAMIDENGAPVKGPEESFVNFQKRVVEYREKNGTINPEDIRKLKEGCAVKCGSIKDRINKYNYTKNATEPVIESAEICGQTNGLSAVEETPSTSLSLTTLGSDIPPVSDGEQGKLSPETILFDNNERFSEETTTTAAEDLTTTQLPTAPSSMIEEDTEFGPSNSYPQRDGYCIYSGSDLKTTPDSYDGTYSDVRTEGGQLESTADKGI
ncbi:MAG: hypothetical protein LBT67_00530 [Holosporaceae bacterium]|jgi:hypothetical protein|nr:hypothetical protein [Holosporaceae bacterium]